MKIQMNFILTIFTFFLLFISCGNNDIDDTNSCNERCIKDYKLGQYYSKDEFQFEIRNNFNGKDDLKIAMLDTFNSKGGCYILISSKPSNNYDCHTCSPSLSILNINKCEVDKEYFVGKFGSFGEIPETEFIEIGENKMAVSILNGFTNQGVTESTLENYILLEDKIVSVLNKEKYYFENPLENQIIESDISFKKTENSAYYNLMITSNFYNNTNLDSTVTYMYKFSSSRYYLESRK